MSNVCCREVTVDYLVPILPVHRRPQNHHSCVQCAQITILNQGPCQTRVVCRLSDHRSQNPLCVLCSWNGKTRPSRGGVL